MSEKTQPNERDDEKLSALLDGELSPETAGALRRRLAEEPALAARLEGLGEVTGQVLGLASPGEGDADRLRVERMHAALRVRLAAAEAEVQPPARKLGEPVAPALFRLSPGWAIPAAAALAAGLALYLGVGSPGPQGADGGLGVAARVAEAPEAPSPAAGLAEGPAAPEAGSVSVPEASELEGAGDDELAIVFEFEVLADFDVIENLDLLERMNELDRVERM